jgi:hypothetical protein
VLTRLLNDRNDSSNVPQSPTNSAQGFGEAIFNSNDPFSEGREEFNKANKDRLVTMTSLVTIILLNYWFFRHENIGCNFDSYFCNRIFLWWIAVPESTLRLFFFALKNSNYALNERKMIALVVPSIGYATWALVVFSFW